MTKISSLNTPDWFAAEEKRKERKELQEKLDRACLQALNDMTSILSKMSSDPETPGYVKIEALKELRQIVKGKEKQDRIRRGLRY